MTDNYLDLGPLPEIARREIYEFYEFLSSKYLSKSSEEIISNKPTLDKVSLLDKYNYLASLITNPSITDPVEWQREIREDKVLYGREE
ncbi:MAG: hypothetical protein HW421_2631 [Ignavibacteria bacterium]|nr:hypothetical protein [Ignavibacteria bacterium]